MSAALKQALLSATAELERLDPASLIAARCRGVLDATGVKGRRGRPLAHPEREKPIADAYAAGKSTMQIANEFGIDQGLVAASLNRQGIKRRTGSEAYVGDRQATLDRVDRIRAARAAGKTLEAIGVAEGLTRERVRQICGKNGIDTTVRPLTAAETDSVEAYASGCNLEEAAQKGGCSTHTMKRLLAQAGVPIRPSRRQSKRQPATLAAAERAAKLYAAGKKNDEIAAELGLKSGPMIYRLLAIAGVSPSRQKQLHRRAPVESIR